MTEIKYPSRSVGRLCVYGIRVHADFTKLYNELMTPKTSFGKTSAQKGFLPAQA